MREGEYHRPHVGVYFYYLELDIRGHCLMLPVSLVFG
jgi:hypothetical protein